MSIRTTYNIDGQLRVINPRSGSSMFVDLSSNQDIYGVKTFINNEQFVDISNTQDIYGVKTFINNEQFVDISYNQDIYGVKTFINNEQFVDISNTQEIYGVKNFISDLLTRNNVNFNTIDGIGRIVFLPNEETGFGGNLLSIYTLDQNDGQGWIFDSNGFLYYLGTGFVSQKIVFDPTGLINAVGAITGGSLSAGTGTISTTGNISGGSLFVGSGAITGGAVNCGSLNANSGTIQTTGTISSGAITCSALNASSGIISTTGDIFGNNITGSSLSAGTGTISTTGTISSGAITCSALNASSGTIQTTGTISSGAITCSALNASSGTIQTTGAINGSTISGTTSVSTPSLLTNAISPRTGDILNFVSFFSINFLQNATVNRIRFFPTRTSGDIFTIFRVSDTNLNNGNWYYSTLGTFGYYANTTDGIKWEILSDGSAKFSGGVLTNSISPYSGTTININPTSNFNLLKSAGVNRILMYPSSISGDVMRIARSGDNAYGDGYWYWNNTGNNGYISSSTVRWEILNNGDITTTTQVKTNTITPNSGTTININPTSNFNLLKSAGVNRIKMFPSSTSGDIFQICRTGDNVYTDGYWYWNNIGSNGYISAGVVKWEFLANGGLSLTNTLNMSDRVIITPLIGTGEIMTIRITAGSEPRFHFSTNSNFGFWNGSSHTYYVNGPTGNITTNGALNCSSIGVSGSITVSTNVTTTTLTVTGSANNALIVAYGGIHLQNNNWLFGRCKFGDADYAYIAEYETGDSDKLYLFGSTGIYCNTLPVVVSDKRLKENIENFIINNPLEIIDKIRLVEYNRIDNPFKTKVLGYIAQEILEIFPKAVEIDQTIVKKDENTVLFKKKEDGTDSEEPVREERLALNYSYISMLNTEAIKQLNKKVDNQQKMIDSLISRLDKYFMDVHQNTAN